MMNRIDIRYPKFSIEYDKNKFDGIPRRLECILHIDDCEVVKMFLDERMNTVNFTHNYNSIGICTNKNYNESVKYLKDKHKELVDSDFRYKKIVGTTGIPLILETFISYLKSEDRNKAIQKIIE